MTYHKASSPKNKEKKLYTQENYDLFFQQQRATLCCPHCRSRHYLKEHGRYRRKVYLCEETRGEIYVKRMKCSCKKTFVVLPPEIIPFKRYLHEIVHECVQMMQEVTIYQAEKQSGLAKGLLSYWKHQFETFHQVIISIHDLFKIDCPLFQRMYEKQRPRRRFMQIISSNTQPFHLNF